ncbi:PREDICTED: LIM domain and actin-binding protein 1-like, partial [Nicotiana attenuata]|uniref:LIM domain and actin-binding protein 1-like n=1 Tax=Nicotiana attenuata TaxID=49451 RepID=UPI00090539E9
MAFAGTTQKCMACEKTVYLVDKLTADNKVYHKACFRCHHCKGTLKLCNYNSFDGVLYCRPHFDQLFKRTVSLDKSFEDGTPKILKPEKDEKPQAAKVSSMFVGTRAKCFGCKNTVYPTEKVSVNATVDRANSGAVNTKVTGEKNKGEGLDESKKQVINQDDQAAELDARTKTYEIMQQSSHVNVNKEVCKMLGIAGNCGQISTGAHTTRLEAARGNESSSKGVKNRKGEDWTVVNHAQQSTSNKKAPVTSKICD